MYNGKSSMQSLVIAPYIQEYATFYNYIDGLPAGNVCAIACTTEGNVFTAIQDALFRFDPLALTWNRVPLNPGAPGPIQQLQPASDGGLWLLCLDSLCHLDAFGAEIVTFHADKQPIFVAGNRSFAWILTKSALIRSTDNMSVALPKHSRPTALAIGAGHIPIVATEQGIFQLIGEQFKPLLDGEETVSSPCSPLNQAVRACVVDNLGNLWTANSGGLLIYRAGYCLRLTEKDGVPLEDLDQLTFGLDGSLWVSSPHGAARLLDGEWRYYAGRRWLSSNRVTSLAVDPSGAAWIATPGGITHLHFRLLSFKDKARHYLDITLKRHFRDGFVTDCKLEHAGELESALPEASDNDGLWTALWIAAVSFQYAVTKDPEAHISARRSMDALLSLVRLTGIPGFPARAVIRSGERVFQSDPGPNWHPSPVDADVLYKGDTSSDEVTGHFFAWYIYSELVAGPEERTTIAATCKAVMNHILDNGYALVGPGGIPTRWGIWSPEKLNFDPDWSAEAGLGALELLSHLKVAQHLCPCSRFQEAYLTLLDSCHYALNVVRQKKIPPEADDNHSDDELAACAFYPLLQLETDPHLRRLYLLGFEDTQKSLRPKRSPFYNILHGACTGKPCDVEAAVTWLGDAPMDLRDWTMTNSHRTDIQVRTERGRFGELQMERVLRPGETRVSKWNQNPFAPDGGRAGMHEEDGTFWLLPYWMGRFHGILKEVGEAE